MPKRLSSYTPGLSTYDESGLNLKNDNGKCLAQINKEPDNCSSLKLWSGENTEPSLDFNSNGLSSFIGHSGESRRLGINKENPEHELDVVGEVSVSGNFEVGKSKLIVHSDSGNVGVGTDKPDELLHINHGNFKIQNVDGSLVMGHSKEILLGTIGKSTTILTHDTPLGVGTKTNHEMRLGTNNMPRITIKNNGYVGIGMTNPHNMLDVHGHINAKGFKVNSNDGFTGSGAYTNFTIENGLITKAW